MPLGPGTRLGPYEIVSAIGAGGMGEVYRARDPRLGRDVAVKVIPVAFASDVPTIVPDADHATAIPVQLQPRCGNAH
jgi:eukaryotic-like serine/threonine-protein kinase